MRVFGAEPAQWRKSQSADSGRHLACAACVLQVNAVVYVGDGRSRDVIRAFEFPGAPSNRSRPYGFEAIITTYELVLKVRPCAACLVCCMKPQHALVLAACCVQHQRLQAYLCHSQRLVGQRLAPCCGVRVSVGTSWCAVCCALHTDLLTALCGRAAGCVLQDAALLRQIHWQYLLVDEAHRLKNSDSALYQELSTWSFKNKLLVTGTPLQVCAVPVLCDCRLTAPVLFSPWVPALCFLSGSSVVQMQCNTSTKVVCLAAELHAGAVVPAQLPGAGTLRGSRGV